MRSWLPLAALTVLLAFAPARADVPVPPLSGRIVDLTQTLTEPQQQQLAATLATLERRKGAQIAVLMLPTTAPETIEAYGIRVADAWKIGRAGVDDGVIVLIAKNDRTMRLEVGYGLEGAVPDAIAKRLIEDYFVPAFKRGDYYSGLSNGLTHLIDVIDGEPLPRPENRPDARGTRTMGDYLPLLLFVVFAVGGLLRSLIGRVGGAAAVGAVAGIAGWLFAGSLLIALLLAIAGFVLTLFGGLGGIGGFGRHGGYRGSGGGFGGGGFSGGGGGFGGGGASGRW